MKVGGRVARAALLLACGVTLSSALLARVDPGLPKVLHEGRRVEVKLELTADGRLLAREIELLEEPDVDEELKGSIEAVDAATRRLTLLGFTVEVEAGTRISREPEGEASFDDLAPGVRVKVDGRRDAEGSFRAKKIRIRQNQQYRERKLVGPIESLEPVEGGRARLRLLGREITVDEGTDLVGPGGRKRPVVRRRLGVIDEDDLQFAGSRRFGPHVALAGEVRLRAERLANPDLDRKTDDDEVVPDLSAIVGIAADLGSTFLYTELLAEREFFLEGEEPLQEETSDVRLGETYFELRGIATPRLSLAIGRQKFNEEREWYYNTKVLDAVRALVDLPGVALEASVSRDLFDESRNLREQDKTNVIIQARHEEGDDLELQGYFIRRDDDAEIEESPRILGLRLLGEPGRHFEYWADLARETGRRGVFDAVTATTVTRDVRAEAADLGATFRPRVAWDPSLTLGYAWGSGEVEAALPEDLDEREAALALLASDTDGTFRQSGIERNRGKFNGVVSFRYYGEVLEPELSNLRIITAGLGLRPRRSVSLDVIYHRYRQDEAGRRLSNAGIDGDPDGTDPELGEEWDVALGFEPDRRVELRMTAGLFLPGDAFDPELEPASAVRLQAKFRF